MDPQPSLVRYGSGRYVPALLGDPGPLPHEERRRTYMRIYMEERRHGSDREFRDIEADVEPRTPCAKEKDVLIDFVRAIFEGRYSLKPMTAEQRIRWMRERMPLTYAHLTIQFQWTDLGA